MNSAAAPGCHRRSCVRLSQAKLQAQQTRNVANDTLAERCTRCVRRVCFLCCCTCFRMFCSVDRAFLPSFLSSFLPSFISACPSYKTFADRYSLVERRSPSTCGRIPKGFGPDRPRTRLGDLGTVTDRVPTTTTLLLITAFAPRLSAQGWFAFCAYLLTRRG